jgi:hypothetical protein
LVGIAQPVGRPALAELVYRELYTMSRLESCRERILTQ